MSALAELEAEWEAGTLTDRDRDRLIALAEAVR